MYYDGPPGMMLDLVGPSPNGVDLEWSHPYSNAQPYRNVPRRSPAHAYAYANNNPTRYIDPSGLLCCSDDTIRNALNLINENIDNLPGLPFVFPWHTSNPHQHCVWNCRMTRVLGPLFSSRQSLQKEQLDAAYADLRDSLQADGCWCNLPLSVRNWIEDHADSAWQRSDFLDNAAGIGCGLSISDTFPWDDTLCEQCCTAIGIGPGTPEGPGTWRPFGPRSKPRIKCSGDP